MEQEAEIDLARSLLAGEPEAFERFVAHFQVKIFRYSWLMCGSPEDAEEVAQETLLHVFQNFAQLREPERIRAWIFRIAKNACLMRRRKSVFAPERELSIDELPPGHETSDGDEGPDLALLRSELQTVLDRAILELPSIYRPVVILRDLEELTTEEAAQILDLSQDTVKTRLHRGRVALRQKLDCYLHNHCLEDQPSPSPAPLNEQERAVLRSVWRTAVQTL